MLTTQNTREKIKEQALNLFSTLGFAGGSVRDIGKKVGVRESALYNYFSSKEELISELIKDAKENSLGIDLLSDELLELLNKPKIFLEKFVEVLLLHWNDELQKKYLRLIIIEQFRHNSTSDISINILVNDTIRIWEMIFSQMLKFNVIKKANPQLLAEEFIYPLFLLRLQFLSVESANLDKIKEKTDSHISYFWNSIKK